MQYIVDDRINKEELFKICKLHFWNHFFPLRQEGLDTWNLRGVKRPDESVETYVYRLEQLFSQALPDVQGDGKEAILKQKLIGGLPEPVKLRLLENPTITYGQVITTTRQLLAAHVNESAYRGGGSVLSTTGRK